VPVRVRSSAPRRSKVRFAPFSFLKKTSARFLAPPLPQKGTISLRRKKHSLALGFFLVAHLPPFRGLRACGTRVWKDRAQIRHLSPHRSKVRFAPFPFSKKTSARFLAPPLPQKGTISLRRKKHSLALGFFLVAHLPPFRGLRACGTRVWQGRTHIRHLSPHRSKVRFAPFPFSKKTSARFLAPPLPQKGTISLRRKKHSLALVFSSSLIYQLFAVCVPAARVYGKAERKFGTQTHIVADFIWFAAFFYQLQRIF